MAEDSENQFDEDDYRTVLRTGGRKALVAANQAFGKLGFKANFTMVANSVLSLEYPPGDRFSPVRILHHSRHINTFLKGRETQLPILHSVMMSSGYETPAAVESTGASLTSTQLVFELLKAIDAGVRDRACGLASELASRGKDELLMDTLRDEAVRRYSYSFPPSLLLNAIRCMLSGKGVTEAAARVAVSAVTSSPFSPDASSVIKALKYAGISAGKVAENDYVPDDGPNLRVAESIRSGIPEMTLRVIADELRKGISARHILDAVCLEALLNSYGSVKKSVYEFAVQNSSSLLESALSSDSLKAVDIMEMMTVASHLSQIYSAPAADQQTRDDVTTYEFEETAALFENGDSSALLTLISRGPGDSGVMRASNYIAKRAVSCDQTGLYSESLCHCSSSILAGSLLDSRVGNMASLRESVSYLSALKMHGARCQDTVSSLVQRETGIPE